MNRMTMINKFSKFAVPTTRKPVILEERPDIVIRKHARDRYKERFNREGITDEYVNKHLTQMLLGAPVASADQKRIIYNTCSHEVRNNYMYNDEYEQYSFGDDIILCVAFREEMCPDTNLLVKTRHIVTLYYM